MRKAYRREEALDLPAAVIAGLVAGLIYIVAQVVLRLVVAGSGGGPALRHAAATLIGRWTTPAADSLPIVATFVALLVHFVLAAVLALLLALLVHRQRLLITTLAGLVFGLCLYLIVFYAAQAGLNWLAPYRGWVSLVSYLLYGGSAGFLYEIIERDRVVPLGSA